MSLPKSWLEFGVLGVPLELVEQEPGREHVDPHAGERHLGLVRHARRVGRLLQEVDDPVLGVDVHHAEAGRLQPRHLQAADRDVGARADVLADHQRVVHLVDVVAGQDHHVVRVVARDDLDVLGHGIGSPEIPLVLGDHLGCRQDVEALVALGAEEAPAVLQVADQAVRLVLRGDRDPADAGVDRIREREVDDPGLAAEEDRGLGALVGQLQEPRAAAAGEHIRHGVAREPVDIALPRRHRPVPPVLMVLRSPAAGGPARRHPFRMQHRLRPASGIVAPAGTRSPPRRHRRG